MISKYISEEKNVFIKTILFCCIALSENKDKEFMIAEYNDLLRKIRVIGRKYLSLRSDKDDEIRIIEDIKQGVGFRGANLWILILAIFVASLGLNVNSTAVIIGAMLISPLMGPIIGMGWAIGTLDLELLKRAFKNYVIATGISIVTATIYFFITPFDEAQSELLARTMPTIYDVLIAFCGGAAGILAVCTKQKSNVIPGVAIATALMPPLCTAGYGIAMGHWSYFLGAFYLYFINSVFICTATFLGVKVMHFHNKSILNKQRALIIRRYFIIIISVTIIPSIFMTVSIVNRSLLNTNINLFAKEQLSSNMTKIISHDLNKENKVLRFVAVGKEISASQIEQAKNKLKDYKLDKYDLQIIQGTGYSQVSAAEDEWLEFNKRVADLEGELDNYKRLEKLSNTLSDEVKVLFPDIKTVSLSWSMQANTADTSKHKTVIAVLESDKSDSITKEEKTKILKWLSARINERKIKLYITE